MKFIVHRSQNARPVLLAYSVALSVAIALTSPAAAQGGFGGGPGGGGRPGGGGMGGPQIESTPSPEKPDAAAKKAYNAGMKSLNKAAGYESAAAAATNEDKKNAALEKQNDAYGRALDLFTYALSNQGDMYDAWNNVGYIHLRLGAYNEAIDDYNHTLALKPDLMVAIEHRAEAYVAVDRLDEAKSAYMEVFNHEPKLAEGLLGTMRQWLVAHHENARGMRGSDIEAFDKWVSERDGIAKQAASR
jgi:tetratricopeptide (TPR) repeat protein